VVAAAVFAAVLLGGIAIFIWRAQPAPPSQAELAADFEQGMAYESGSGVTLDYGRALGFYRKAAERGYPPAEYKIGELTAAGRGVVKDEKTAVEWFRRAAEHGVALAQVRLAQSLGSGIGTPDGKPDAVEAMKWLLLAADALPDDNARRIALEVRDKISQAITPEQRAEAERRAKEWRKQ